MGKTLAEKIWDDHIVRSAQGEPDLLYIDLQLVHEVTSAQAFDGLRLAGRKVRRPDLTIATEDHNTPTLDILKPIADPVSRLQIETLRNNAKEFGIASSTLEDVRGGDAAQNLAIMKELFKGKPGAVRDIVTFNAGCALFVSGVAGDVMDGIERARASIDSGSAAAVLSAVAEESSRQLARMEF